jgi:hypothetical protein
MVKVLPEGTRGIATVQHFEVTEGDSNMTALHGGASFVPPGRYARLMVNRSVVMSDTRFEKLTNYEVVSRAHGRVLIAGLGLGMILHPILRKGEVKSVVVVEKHRDVIDLVTPHYSSRKLRVVCADIFEWVPEPGEKFDVIYFDIWPDQTTANLCEMGKLHQRFKYRLDRENPERWMDSWSRDLLRSQQRTERRMWPR